MARERKIRNINRLLNCNSSSSHQAAAPHRCSRRTRRRRWRTFSRPKCSAGGPFSASKAPRLPQRSNTPSTCRRPLQHRHLVTTTTLRMQTLALGALLLPSALTSCRTNKAAAEKGATAKEVEEGPRRMLRFAAPRTLLLPPQPRTPHSAAELHSHMATAPFLQTLMAMAAARADPRGPSASKQRCASSLKCRSGVVAAAAEMALPTTLPILMKKKLRWTAVARRMVGTSMAAHRVLLLLHYHHHHHHNPPAQAMLPTAMMTLARRLCACGRGRPRTAAMTVTIRPIQMVGPTKRALGEGEIQEGRRAQRRRRSGRNRGFIFFTTSNSEEGEVQQATPHQQRACLTSAQRSWQRASPLHPFLMKRLLLPAQARRGKNTAAMPTARLTIQLLQHPAAANNNNTTMVAMIRLQQHPIIRTPLLTTAP